MSSASAKRSLETIWGVILIWIEWILLLLAIAAFTITEEYTTYVTLGLALLAASFMLRGLRKKRLIPGTGLEIPFILFILSAALASWISYNHPASFLQFARILAAIVLFYAVIDANPLIQRLLVFGFVAAAAFLALYWPIQHDFISEPSKFGFISSIGVWVNGNLPQLDFSTLTGPSIHANVAAGTLALAIPFGIASVYYLWKLNKKIVAFLFGLLSLIIAAGLIMTTSRGAWLALFGTTALVGLVFIQRKWLKTGHQKTLYWGCVALFVIIALGGLLVTDNLSGVLGQIPGPSGTLQSRIELWRQGSGLIRDYPFTGSGLVTFWRVQPTYSSLIYVNYLAHVHNTFLEVWIEQGVLAAMALILGTFVIAIWAWKALSVKYVCLWGWAGLAGLLIVAVHGIVDVVFYIERTLPLIGMALGFTFLINDPQTRIQKNESGFRIPNTHRIKPLHPKYQPRSNPPPGPPQCRPEFDGNRPL
jgi:O-antigen ligase